MTFIEHFSHVGADDIPLLTLAAITAPLHKYILFHDPPKIRPSLCCYCCFHVGFMHQNLVF